MRVNPAARPVTERHVRFNEIVEVRIYIPDATHTIQPTLNAQRIERMAKAAPTAQPVVVVEQNRIRQNQVVQEAKKCWKNSCHLISLVCGAAFLPSFVCLTIGPIGAVVPASLLVGFLATAILGCKETPEMAERIEVMRQRNQNFDYRQS